ncbi:uncharacterized protein EAE97_000837 [Botrytis byssoidea]|uniref:Uncharacterized protein n=1 Tax=Botrytis byssoidea TaxID=139641 RepID=A0A9P5M3D7_9HELO|nr:uncharacterized protein EAE97_000837 [Botrytis byssoidea]KAF7953438.1 hypothetical protein EAE97_000837 [Botrytis byssoidea]
MSITIKELGITENDFQLVWLVINFTLLASFISSMNGIILFVIYNPINIEFNLKRNSNVKMEERYIYIVEELHKQSIHKILIKIIKDSFTRSSQNLSFLSPLSKQYSVLELYNSSPNPLSRSTPNSTLEIVYKLKKYIFRLLLENI